VAGLNCPQPIFSLIAVRRMKAFAPIPGHALPAGLSRGWRGPSTPRPFGSLEGGRGGVTICPRAARTFPSLEPGGEPLQLPRTFDSEIFVLANSMGVCHLRRGGFEYGVRYESALRSGRAGSARLSRPWARHEPPGNAGSTGGMATTAFIEQ
jgi:hypothetical protein